MRRKKRVAWWELEEMHVTFWFEKLEQTVKLENYGLDCKIYRLGVEEMG
jgi:hypothetical protein